MIPGAGVCCREDGAGSCRVLWRHAIGGLLLGPDSDTVFMQDPVAVGVGELPQAIWWTTNHTNELGPLWTKGVGSEMFASLFDGTDPRRGSYIDNTDVCSVMSSVVPEPSTASAMIPLAVIALRRRRG